MLIPRLLKSEILRRLSEQRSKIIVVYGARQVGKTTLVEEVLAHYRDTRILVVNGDSFQHRELLSSCDRDRLRAFAEDADILFIDEAQRIENIGINLKILHDTLTHLKIIVTGSSALDLANKIKEPLTGRTHTYKLYPLALLELREKYMPFELMEQLESRMIFGSYPEVLSIEGKSDKISYLQGLASDYLYKDVLELENIRYNNKLRNLLKMLAFQIGSEVSYSEISNALGISRQTVDTYIDLLEKSFVLIRLYAFSRNLRKEVNKKPKIYFYDLGIRNALINNFSYFDLRDDLGALWENFLILERLKHNEYQRHYCNQYFWRTYTGAELDYIEEYSGKLHGYEFKYNKTSKAPKTWLTTYAKEKSSFECINKDNFLDFVM